MQKLSKHILEAINRGVMMSLDLDDEDDIESKDIFKKDVRAKASSIIDVYAAELQKQCETLSFDEYTEKYLKVCNANNYAFKYKIKDKGKLQWFISRFIKFTGNYNADLNWIDISDINDLSALFYNTNS